MEKIHAAVHPDDRIRWMESIEQAPIDKMSEGTCIRIFWPDGSSRSLQCGFKKEVDGSGTPVSILGIMIDNTSFSEQWSLSERARHLMHEAQLLAQLGSWVWNIDEDWMEFSEGAWRFAESEPRARISLKDSLGLVHPEDRDRVRESAERVARSNSPGEIELEYRVLGSKGTIRQVLQRSRDLPRGDGSTRFRLGTVLDVTAIRNAEDQIRRHIQLLREAQILGKAGYWVWRIETGRFEISDSLREMIGMPGAKDLSMEDVFRLVHPDDRAKVRASILNAESSGGEKSLEYRICLESGQIRNIVQRSRPYESPVLEGGKARLGTMVDVTDIRRAEAQSKQAQWIAESALRMAKAGSWFWDPQEKQIFWSSELYQLSGVKSDTILTFEYWHTLIHAEDLNEFILNEKKKFSGVEQGGLFFRMKRPDNGEVRYFEMRGQWTDKVGSDGKIFFAINLDVTERRKDEEAKRQAQKLEAIGRLAGGVAHDFNNLLTVMLGHAEELNAHAPNDRLHQILKAGSLGAALTQRLLAFSRQAVVRPQKIEISQVIKGMGELLERLLGEDVRIEYDLKASADLVSADIGQIEQIILNLAINARDAMPEGGLLRLRTRVVGEVPEDAIPNESPVQRLVGENFVMLSIEDNGLGMSPDVFDHLFEPFFTTKEPGRGTGLGLSTILGILAGGQGRIRVQSCEGKGTCFEVYWPQESEDAKVDDLNSNLSQKISSSKGRVGVVEDNPELRKLLVEMLASADYEVEVFATAMEAVDCPQKKAEVLDLLITDMVMPGFSGQLVAEKLRSLKPELPVLFISGYPRMDLGEDLNGGYLQKPFTRGQLIEAVGQCLLQSS